MGDLTKNFSLSEFFSPNDRGTAFKARTPVSALLSMLETIRETVGKPVRIESGVRSVEHNKKLGGAGNSAHLTGEAADIWVDGMTNRQLGSTIRGLQLSGRLPQLTYSYLIKGTSSTRVHVGVDKRARKSIWGEGY